MFICFGDCFKVIAYEKLPVYMQRCVSVNVNLNFFA